MASDHQTQAGKPQPLNSKVGTLLEGGAGILPVPLCTQVLSVSFRF